MVKPTYEEREQRILDAAEKLFSHYGYDKTTVSDIAREAGISKGAIYLHYKSKDALFEGLLTRELEVYTKRWMERIHEDPKGGTIGGMYKSSLYALSKSPFMAAMFKKDTRVLGSYLRKPDNLFRQEQHKSTRFEFIQMMQAAGAMRGDMDAKVVAHIMNMLAYGLVGINEVMDEEDIPPIGDVIEGIAELMDRALTPKDGNGEKGKELLQKMVELGRLKHERAQQEKEQQAKEEKD